MRRHGLVARRRQRVALVRARFRTEFVAMFITQAMLAARRKRLDAERVVLEPDEFLRSASASWASSPMGQAYARGTPVELGPGYWMEE